MPPPPIQAMLHELPVTVQLLTLRVLTLAMPPPPGPLPAEMVRPEMPTDPLATVKIPKNPIALLSRFTVSDLAPGPFILMLLVRFGNGLAKLIVPVTAK